MATNMELDVEGVAIESSSLKMVRNMFEGIAQHLSPWDISKVAALHPSLALLPPFPVEQQFKSFLSKYFTDTDAIRSTMREFGCVISGSSALAFITRPDNWSPSDLDLYTPLQYGDKVADFICSTEGYEVLHKSDWQPETEAVTVGDYRNGLHGIQSVIKLSKMGPGGEELKIDIVVSKSSSGIQPITYFHSTVVMNYITADEAVVFYPLLLQQKRLILQHGMLMLNTWWAGKYESRGFTQFATSLELSEGEPCGAACPVLPRSSKDAHCWRLRFGVSDLTDTFGEAEWRLNLPRILGKRSCWNAACPRNEIQVLTTQVMAYRQDAEAIIHPEIHDGDGTNHHTETEEQYGLDIGRFKDTLGSFTELGLAIFKHEWALVVAYRRFERLRELYDKDQPRIEHNGAGFFRHALHHGTRSEWRTRAFRDEAHQRYESEADIQAKREELHAELSNFISQHYISLLRIRAQSTGYKWLKDAKDWPEASLARVALRKATDFIRDHMLRPDAATQLTRAEAKQSYHDLYNAIYRASSMLKPIIERQTILFRLLNDAQMQLPIVFDDIDARIKRNNVGKKSQFSIKDKKLLAAVKRDSSRIETERCLYIQSLKDLATMVGVDYGYDREDEPRPRTNPQEWNQAALAFLMGIDDDDD